MALTNVQMNVISALQHMASELVSIQSRTAALAQMYTNEGIGALSDADIQSLPSFGHITAAELQAAATAMAAVNTTLNAGTPPNWSKMLKIVEALPK